VILGHFYKLNCFYQKYKQEKNYVPYMTELEASTSSSDLEIICNKNTAPKAATLYSGSF
jgi:hypothetical protein